MCLVFATGLFPVGLTASNWGFALDREIVFQFDLSGTALSAQCLEILHFIVLIEIRLLICPLNRYPGPPGIILNAYPGPPGNIDRTQLNPPEFGTDGIKVVAIIFSITSRLRRRYFHRRIAKAFMDLLCAIFATII